jgi:hypothetical protein
MCCEAIGHKRAVLQQLIEPIHLHREADRPAWLA